MNTRGPLQNIQRLQPMPRAEVVTIPLAPHGALDYVELAKQGIQPGDVIDFSENSNPFGPSPRVREALAAAIAGNEIARYPDRETLVLRREIAHHVGAPVDSVLVGNGAAELLWLVCFAWLRPDDRVLLLAPTFGEYARMARLMGAQVIALHSDSAQTLAFPLGRVVDSLAAHSPKLFFICRPNNPTGEIVPLAELRFWAETFPQTLFVIDEAYLEFVPGMVSAHALHLPNILIVCSMTKVYALAGLRLGYAVGSADIIHALRHVRVPWSVNAFALVAGREALLDQPYLASTLAKLSTAKEEFSTLLAAEGYAPHPSPMNYMLLRTGDAATLRRRLLQRGLVVRDCTSFGMPQYIRISTQLPAANQQFVRAIREIRAE